MSKKKTIILNSEGNPIVLNKQEKLQAKYNEKTIKNATGYNIDITALTTITRQVIEQKFFQVAPADYFPVKVGEGSWSEILTTYREFQIGDDFESGIVNTGSDQSKLAEVGAGVDAVSIKVRDWAKQCNWTLMELAKASEAGNWDIVTSKQKARKKNWDLGIQKVGFLGLPGLSAGLLTQPNITNNTSRITKAIKSMDPAELKAFTSNLITDYRKNNNYTAYPDRFVIPEDDFTGLAGQAAPDFPVKSTLELLQQAFRTATMNDDFQILPLAYANASQNTIGGASGTNRYMLYRYDEDVMRMDIPVDYTATMANSHNSFQFSNVGYGQFTGLQTYRPKEALYFSYTS